jgi:hypothetical protein
MDLSLVTGFYAFLTGVAPLVSLGCFVAAALQLRGEGGVTFDLTGGFAQSIFWGLIFLVVPTVPAFLQASGVPVATLSGGVEPIYLAGIQNVIQNFVTNYLLGHLVPAVTGMLVLKALLDSAEGHSPIPSLVSAIFVLSVNGLWNLAKTWAGTDEFGLATAMTNMVAYIANSVCPMAGTLCIIGAVVNYLRVSVACACL